MSLWYVVRLTTYLDFKSREIRSSGFDFKSNLTSAIGDSANRSFLASYVSCHKAMAYDRVALDMPHRAIPSVLLRPTPAAIKTAD
jgi:hypothetical protein